VILSDGGVLRIPDLAGRKVIESETEGLLPLREMEREHIIKALRACNWRVSGKGGAAELLGLKPTTLYSKIRKLGISKNLSYR
jgi:transcriptional regulator of acetoin/glycerol metabolism